MTASYKLTIAGSPSLHKGICKASIRHCLIELVLSDKQNGKVIKRTNLAANRTSLETTLRMTQEKITLLCNRLSINEEQLDYDRSELSGLQKAVYKILFLNKRLFVAFIPIQWSIVYKGINEKKWKRIIPDSKVFQADPFIVFKDNRYFVFYEELKFENYHGYLMAAELDIKDNKLINQKVILNLEHHLSFPNVFEVDHTFYMIPECGDSNCVDLYECTRFPYEWKKKKTLLEDTKAVDTIPLHTDDGWYLFTSEIIKGADCNDELSIYKSEDLLNKPFKKLYDKPVVSDVRNARMAGHFIKQKGELFRLSQNSAKRYGHKINMNKVIQIEGGYKEEFVKTFKPSMGALGFHTYNQSNDIIIADMEFPRFDAHSLKWFVWGNIKRELFNK